MHLKFSKAEKNRLELRIVLTYIESAYHTSLKTKRVKLPNCLKTCCKTKISTGK